MRSAEAAEWYRALVFDLPTANHHEMWRFTCEVRRRGFAARDDILGGVQRGRSSSRSLDARLAAAQAEPSVEPLAAWQRLRQAEGRRTTVIDLYELVARRRGLAGHQLPQTERVELARSVMAIIWPGFA